MRCAPLCLLIAVLSPTAFAVGTPTVIGPFATGVTDGFEDFAYGSYDCANQGNGHTLLGNSANMCNADPLDLQLISALLGGPCTSIFARTGTHMLENDANTLTLLFQPRVKKFGGYFLSQGSSADGTATFYDGGGNFMASLPVSMALDCAWHWNGWEAPVGQDIAQVHITGTGAGAFMLDDLIVDYSGELLPAPVIYCTATTSSIGCVPTLTTNYDGLTHVPSANATDTFELQASNLPGLKTCAAFYSMYGAQAAPIGSGLLCVRAPLFRALIVNSGGSGATCTGAALFDLNHVFTNGGSNPNYDRFQGYPFPPGLTLYAQVYYRDPLLLPPILGGLTEAVKFTLE